MIHLNFFINCKIMENCLLGLGGRTIYRGVIYGNQVSIRRLAQELDRGVYFK